MEHAKTIRLSSEAQAPELPVIKRSRSGWVSYGAANDFPQKIIMNVNRSPVTKAIIDSTVTYICGKGIRDTGKSVNSYVSNPNPKNTWDDILEPLAKDYKTFGGFYLQVVLNKDGITVSVFHQDFSEVRVGQTTEEGDPLTFRISKDWKKATHSKTLELNIWPGVHEAKPGIVYISHHWDYEPGLSLYSIPGWYASIDYVKADGKLGPFYNNSISNGFTPSVIISMPSSPPQEKKEEIQEQMEEAFGGVEGASSIMILWGEGKDVKPEIVPFSAAGNADIYNKVEGIIFQKIVSSHRLASPTLAGVSGSGNLSGNAAEIIDSYVLYNFTVVEKLRRKILDALNIFTKINKVDALEIEELDVIKKISESMAAPDSITAQPDSSGDTQPEKLTSSNNSFLRKLKKLLNFYYGNRDNIRKTV